MIFIIFHKYLSVMLNSLFYVERIDFLINHGGNAIYYVFGNCKHWVCGCLYQRKNIKILIK
jgi:hypothetical protein